MRKIIYCLFTVLLPYPLNANASSHEPIPASIEISYINVTLDGKNINSGVVEVTPGQQLRLHIVFNYYGDTITNYPATRLRLDAGNFKNEVEILPNHFEKITDNQAAEDVIIVISTTAKAGEVIPVKFIIDGPDINSEEGETITFVIKDSSTDTTDSGSSTEGSSDSSEINSSSENSTDSDSRNSSDVASTDPTSITSETDDSNFISSTSSNTSSHSSETVSNDSENSLHTSTSIIANETTKPTISFVNPTKSAKKKAQSTLGHPFSFLPKTGTNTSVLGWMGFGVVNIVAAIYLLRKK